MSRKVLLKLHDTNKVLKRTIMDATEVTVPTTFIILPQKITSEGKKDIVINGNEKDADKIVTFIESLASTWQNVTALIGYDVVYMYLIDEYTGKPVIPDKMDEIYPIPINVITDGEFLKSISPYLAIGFKFVSTANSIAGMINYLGFPTPTIPIDRSTEAFIKSFVDGNSVGENSNLSKAVSSVISKDQNGNTNVPNIQNTRGAALRELKKFFTDKDRNGTFCQLRRVAAVTGHCMWTTEENFKKMESDKDDDDEDNLFAEIVKNKKDANHNAGTEIDQNPLSAITPMMMTNNNNTDNTSISTSILISNYNHNSNNTSISTEEIANIDQHPLSAPEIVEEVNSNYCNNFCCSSCRKICCTCYG